MNKCINLCGGKNTLLCESCKGRREEVYTQEQWAKDGTIKAEPMQEVEECIYYDMLNGMPPIYLQPIQYPDVTMIKQVFAMGEAYTHGYDEHGCYRAYYMTFGVANDKYYYLGLRNSTGKSLKQ